MLYIINMPKIKRCSTKAFGDRFKESLTLLGLMPASACELLGYSNASTIYSVIAGRCLPDLTKLSVLAKLRTVSGRRINIDWLITGEGEKLLALKTSKANREVEAVLSKCSQKKIKALAVLLE